MRATPGARVGWQRQRAWIEGLASLEITYSSSPSGSPSHRRWYSSSTREALAVKPGSRMEIHDWCCQGLASLEITYSSSPSGSPSHRRWYSSSTREALAVKPGSRMEIHDWCCQGLIGSS